MTPEISLILPAYNESRVIPKTIGEAVDYFESRKLTYEIIVAADGADGTREIVHSMAATNPALHAIGANARRGKGRGVREAVGMASGKIIGYADADNKVPIDDFDKFRPAPDKGIEMVIGSRRGGAVIEGAADVPPRGVDRLPLFHAVSGGARRHPGYAVRLQVFPARRSQENFRAIEG